MSRNHRDAFNSGCFYHLYNKVISEVKLYKTANDYNRFIERYCRYFGGYFETYAYCLIPNHFHFLVRVKDDVENAVKSEKTRAALKYMEGKVPLNFVIENQLSRMFSGLAIKYNRDNNRVGPLFKEGTKRVLLKTESRVIYQMCYIHHNAIHHNLEKTYSAWKHSSYKIYKNNCKTFIAKTEMISMLGGMDVFDKLHSEFEYEQAENLFQE